jgi:hypothetical protein
MNWKMYCCLANQDKKISPPGDEWMNFIIHTQKGKIHLGYNVQAKRLANGTGWKRFHNLIPENEREKIMGHIEEYCQEILT